MDKRISTEMLDEIERRCAAATPGPWKSFIEARDHMVGSDFIQTAGEDIYLTGATPADQDFIAHARQDHAHQGNQSAMGRQARIGSL